MHFSDYIEQLTYLLFLKMADERTQAPYNQIGIVAVLMQQPADFEPMFSEREVDGRGMNCPILPIRNGSSNRSLPACVPCTPIGGSGKKFKKCCLH